MLKNYLIITWKVLLRKRLYTIISLFCISITIMFLTIITTFVNHLGTAKSPQSNINRVLSLDIVSFYNQNENGQRDENNSSPPNYYFIKKYVKTLDLPEITAASSYGALNPPIYVYKNNKKYKLKLIHTDADFFKIWDFRFVAGRFYNNKEFEQAHQYAVIDMKTSRLYFGDTNPLGQDILLINKKYKVIGLIEDVDASYLNIAANIYIPLTSSEVFNGNSPIPEGGNYYPCNAYILAKKRKDFEQIQKELDQALKKMDFSIPGAEGKGRYNKVSAILDVAFYGMLRSLTNMSKEESRRIIFLIISLLFLAYILIPSTNLLNINTNRIYERGSEIGVRKSFGANRLHLLIQFLIENLFLTFMGGVIGLCLTIVFFYLFNASGVIPNSNIHLNINAFLISLLGIICMGLFSGIIPSYRMSKLTIINALISSE